MATKSKSKTFGNRIVSFLFSGVDQYLAHEQRREARGWPLERLIVEANKAFTAGSSASKVKIVLVELIHRASVDPKNLETIRRLLFPAARLLDSSSTDRALHRLVVILLKDLLRQHSEESSSFAMYQDLAKSCEKRMGYASMLVYIVPPADQTDVGAKQTTSDPSVAASVLKSIQSIICDKQLIGGRETVMSLVALLHLMWRAPNMVQREGRDALLELVADCIERHAYSKRYPMVVYHGISVVLSCASEEVPFVFWESIFPHLQFSPLAQVLLVRHAIQTGHDKFLAFVVEQSRQRFLPPQDSMVTMEAIAAVLQHATRYTSATLGPAYTILDQWAAPSSASALLCSLAIRTLAKYASPRESVVFVETCLEPLQKKPQLRPSLGDSWMEPVCDHHVSS